MSSGNLKIVNYHQVHHDVSERRKSMSLDRKLVGSHDIFSPRDYSSDSDVLDSAYCSEEQEILPYEAPHFEEDHCINNLLGVHLDEWDSPAHSSLRHRLEEELKAAKSQHLSCGEVLLPQNLMSKIVTDIIRMAENEPCGLRGCHLYLYFQDEDERKAIGEIRCDSTTVSTFELSLTLKRDVSLWSSVLPNFLRNLTRSSTVVLSPGYLLKKNKLYRSYSQCND